MSEEQKYAIDWDAVLGHCELETRMRWEGNKCIGEGRSKHFDRHGKLTRDTGWEPTGVTITVPEPKVSWQLGWIS